MKLKSIFSLAAITASLTFTSGFAQEKTIHFCQQHVKEKALQDLSPEIAHAIEAEELKLENFTQSFENNNQRSTQASTYIIPLVFHIIHLNGEENISDAQILDAVRIINEDFNARNSDLDEVVPSFQSIIGNGDIEFRLARLDPNGNPTDGIDRILSAETNVGDDGSKLNQWPRNKYINIWVVNQLNGATGAAAYAYLPATANSFPSIDGIIANHRYVGSIGTSSEGGKHTLTHELGHVLNLRHPWGPTNEPGLSSNCSTDDGVSDTPNTIGTFGTCNTSQTSCGSLDNVQNLMDYASCDRMFTQGQISRMHATLNSSTAQRNNLWTQQNLIETGVYQLTTANFGAIDPTICEGESVDFEDWSEFGAESWDWTFEAANISSSTDEYPTATYNIRGSFQVDLTVEQGTISETETKTGFVMVSPSIGYAVPVQEDFESTSSIPNQYWYNHTLRDFPDYGWKLTNTGFNSTSGLMVENYNASADLEFELESSTFDLSVYSAASVTFDYAYARKDASDGDRLMAYVSTDCGETWTPTFSRFGASLATAGTQTTIFTPSGTADWSNASFSLSGSFLSDATQIKFVFFSGGGNNLYLDNINISGDFISTAQLDFPYNGMQDRSSNTTLYWKPMTCDQYEVQLDTDPSFSNPTTSVQDFIGLSVGSDNQFDATNLVPSETYYWRVRLLNNGTPENWSETWSFHVAANGVGFDEAKIDNVLRVYPNPSSSQVTIQFEGENGVGNIVVTDLYGRTVYSGVASATGEKLNLNTQDWSTGMYLVNLSYAGKEYSKKLLIQR